ncbi:MAG TPA: TauD/TfdA family dioxygenase [Xanthobacteraceae bacterium]|jgi:taurine dioxygenase|nr:TauD/TfdA family dioxygenase [Xanthobacteraceae bacterium]
MDAMNTAATYDTITVTPSTPHVGAEIGNIDLTRPLSNRQVEEVHQAILAHGVLFFRDQKISFDDHERFIRYFGEPHVHVGGKGTASRTVPDHPAIRHQYFDASSKRVSGEEWHSDQSCAEKPPSFSVLYQEIIPPDGGGDTMFASAYKAYDELSDGMKTYLQGKTATHDGSRVFDKGRDTYPIAVHPIVIRHPDTGRKLLFVNREFTSHINDVPEAEGRAVLEFLCDHIGKPHWSMRFHWTEHCIAFWDNRCVQHFAIWDYWPNVRSGYRMFVKGTEKPIPG